MNDSPRSLLLEAVDRAPVRLNSRQSRVICNWCDAPSHLDETVIVHKKKCLVFRIEKMIEWMDDAARFQALIDGDQ